MKHVISILALLLLIGNHLYGQPRDRRAELIRECRNWAVTHTSVAPDGSLWMVCSYSAEIFWANNIHSTWKTLAEAEDGPSLTNHENITAFDRKTAVITGNMWPKDIKRTSSRGLMWDFVDYTSQKGFEWFHPAWRGEEGRLWTGSQDGLLIFSADSGCTFTTLRDTAFDHKTGIEEIYMFTADSGFIGGSNNELYSTSDNWRTYHRIPTPFDQNATTTKGSVNRIRQWKNYLIVKQGSESFYTPIKKIHWQRTPLTLYCFEVDRSTGRLWGIDDSRQVVLIEDLDHWTPMGIDALATVGIHDGRLYCRVEEGIIRVGVDKVVDSCPFLTTERLIDEPKTSFAHGKLMWGTDGTSVYILDSKGWYRVARVNNIWGMSPDPDREDRVVIMTDQKENYSLDTAGRLEPYTYRQPLAAFVMPGLQSMTITTYKNIGHNVFQEEIAYQRNGDSLLETYNTVKNASTSVLRLPVATVEQALLALGKRYNRYPTPLDFGLEDSTLDLHDVFEVETNWRSSNKHGYIITLVNQAGDTLKAIGETDSHVNLGGSTRFPWLLPMYISWREAEFFTYQPVLWQTLREAMPDSMFMKDYLDNSTLRPEEKLQSGDLLFVSSKWYESDMEQAIKASTGQYSHVALVEVDSLGVVWVIEATPGDGVKRKTFNRFKIDNHLNMFGSFDIYRFSIPFDTAAVIARAKSRLGQPYDDAFLPDNGALYCSELIYECFLDAAGKHLFEAKPMNWRDKEGNLPKYWEKHFTELGVPLPEGVPGTNPTDMSRSPLLRKL